MAQDDGSAGGGQEQGIVSIDLGTSSSRVKRILSAQRKLHTKAKEHFVEITPDEHVGANQRLSMRIPTAGKPAGTIISGGKGGPASFDGYAVKTIGHVAMTAEGGVAASSMTLQANGQVMVQSDQASLFLLSTAPATLASTSVTNVAGAGVVIAAGGGAPVKMIPITSGDGKSSGTAPGAGAGVPESVSGASDAAQSTSDKWKGWDDALKSANSARDDLRKTMDPARAAAYVSPVAGTDAKSSLVDANKAGDKSAAAAGGLVMHGEKTVLIGTPGTGSFRAVESLTLSSKTVAMIAETSGELVVGGPYSSTISGTSSWLAKGRVDIVSHEGILHVATRTGEAVQVQGKALAFGEIAPEDPQVITEHVHVRSKTHVGIATDVDPSRGKKDAGIHMDSHAVIEARSASTVTIQAKDSVTLCIGDQEIDLVVDKAGKITVRAKTATLELDQGNGATISHRNTKLITGMQGKVMVGTGPSDKVEVLSGSLSIKSGSIKIG
jgi:hypothetical protein